MGQEFFINSSTLEEKVRNILPSQGGAGAGFDLSASTTIIPIVDLTESAEGSILRQDLQSSLSLSSITSSTVTGTTTTLINNVGYFRVFGNASCTTSGFILFSFTDGTTTKTITSFSADTQTLQNIPFDFIVFINTGESLLGQSSGTGLNLYVNTRQLADITGTLINPN